MIELGVLCLGGFLLGLILAVPIAIVKAQYQHEQERLEQEAKRRLREYEAEEREAYRLDLTKTEKGI